MVEEQNKCACFLFKNNDVEGILTPQRLEGNYVKEGQCWYYLRQTLNWEQKIQSALSSTEEILSDQRKEIEDKFIMSKKEVEDLLKEFENLRAETKSLKRVQDMKSQYNESKIQKANDMMNIIRDKVYEVKTTEKLLTNADYFNEKYDDAVNFWDPYFLLFQTIKGFKEIGDFTDKLQEFDFEAYKIDLEETKKCLKQIKEETDLFVLARKQLKQQDHYNRNEERKTNAEIIFDDFSSTVSKNEDLFKIVKMLGLKELETVHKNQILILFELPNLQGSYDDICTDRVGSLFNDWPTKKDKLKEIC